MAKCSKCKSEVKKPCKSWKYGIFTVKPTLAKTARHNSENIMTKTENTASH